MFGIMALLGAIGITGKVIKEKCETVLPAEYHGNMRAEAEDARKVMLGEMSKREFNRNINNGKYYAPRPKYDYDLWIKRIEKYKEIYPNRCHYKTDVDLQYVRDYKRLNLQLTVPNSFWRYEDMDKYL